MFGPVAIGIGGRPEESAMQSKSIDVTEPGGIIPLMILTLDAKRRLTLPASLLPAQPGDHFRAEFDPEEDAVVFRRIAKRANQARVVAVID